MAAFEKEIRIVDELAVDDTRGEGLVDIENRLVAAASR